MQIWLDKLQIPVLPAEYSISTSQNDQTATTIGLGEVLLKGKRGLKQISFSSFFPKRYDASFCNVSNIQTPAAYVKQIEKMKESGTVKVVVTGAPVNLRCRIESFNWKESGGTGDISYDITLKEYRNIKVEKSKTKSAASASAKKKTKKAQKTGKARTSQKESQSGKGTTYTVVKGDTLTGIARKMYGTTDWNKIYEQNKAVIGGNPNFIQIGMKLVIP